MVTKVLAGAILAFSPSVVLAGEVFEMDSRGGDLGIVTTIQQVETPVEVKNALAKASINHRPDEGGGITLEQIVNIGRQIWAVIEANKPVVDIKYDYANALPLGLTSSSRLTNFSDMQHTSYRMSGKNGWGVTVYDLTFTVVHQYGGQFEGKGRFLESVSIIPSHLDVMWGYTVNFDVGSIRTTNAGTAADPIGSIIMGMKFKVSTVIQSSETNILCHFRGDQPTVSLTTL